MSDNSIVPERLQTSEPIPFTVVGGFLGAGKTTLINRILHQSEGIRFAILVNDFGALNIDQALIKNSNGKTLALTNGCICCSLSNGFINTMLELMQHATTYDQIIVETSGVSLPDRIMDFARLDPALSQDAIIILVDATGLKPQLQDTHIAGIIKSQIQSADLLLINKSDCVNQDSITSTHSLLREINPDAAVISCEKGNLPISLLLGSTRQSLHKSKKEPTLPYLSSFSTIAMFANSPIEKHEFEYFINNLPKNIFRGKGFVTFNNHPKQPFLWQRVGRSNTITCHPNSNHIATGRCDVVLIGGPKLSVKDLPKSPLIAM